MHSAVLQNKKYISFSNKNTVEVMAMSSLERGIEAGDRKASTYEAKGPDGDKVEYLVEFPGLTVDDMQGLVRSKARSYNKSGKIPYTAIIDPHSLEEIKGFVGGQSAKTLMAQVSVAKKKLDKEHGKGITRAEYRSVTEGEADVARLSGAGEWKKAAAILSGLQKKNKNWPEVLTSKIDNMKETLESAADKAIGDLRALSASDPNGAKRGLRKITAELRGTDLADKAQKVLDSIG